MMDRLPSMNTVRPTIRAIAWCTGIHTDRITVDLERSGRGIILGYSLGTCLMGLRTTMQTLSQSRCLGRESNRAPPKYK
jgi:hypothetical protein